MFGDGDTLGLSHRNSPRFHDTRVKRLEKGGSRKPLQRFRGGRAIRSAGLVAHPTMPRKQRLPVRAGAPGRQRAGR